MNYLSYYSPGAASMAVHWMLLEAGLPFDAYRVDIDAGAQHDEAYRRLNPQGRVPTLVIDGIPHAESAALMMLLAERHPEAGLAPAPGTPPRASWMEMMIYLANTLLPAMRDWFYADSDGDPAGADAVRALARARIEAAWERLDGSLAGWAGFSEQPPYLLGDLFSTVDILAVTLMRWSRNMPRPATDWPHLAAYIHRLRARPAFIETNAREGLTDWRNG